MSLLATASAWTTDDDTENVPKKRNPTIKSGIKKALAVPSPNSNYSIPTASYTPSDDAEFSGKPVQLTHHSIQHVQEQAEQRGSRVSELINKITAPSGDDTNLADFRPARIHPGIHPRATNAPIAPLPQLDDQINPLLPGGVPKINRQQGNVASVGYSPVGHLGGSQFGQYSQYSDAQKRIMQSGLRQPEASRDALLEKINYMIHLLEEQQMEKTNHVTEEFLMYSLLGVFVIYVVDSFSRAGKYVR
jgi:hypothetical protein